MLVLLWTTGALAGDAINYDSQISRDIESAGQRALSQDALNQRKASAGQGNGGGIEVELNIQFPANQVGLSNILNVLLEPDKADAHECTALALVRGSTITANFVPKKDVKPGRAYTVIANDSRDGRYVIGRIQVGSAAHQQFTMNAPLLGPNSSQDQPQSLQELRKEQGSRTKPSSGHDYTPPNSANDYTPPRSDDGFKPPAAGPGFIPPSSGD